MVTNVEKMLTRIVGEDIEMRAVMSPQLGAISADLGQIEQLLMNLVVNARDAMPTGGTLTLETANVELPDAQAAQLGVTPGRYVRLTVSDTGCGMDAATSSRIFEPFFTTKLVGKGTGLGLSIVFGIVAQSSGAIDVHSEVGHGTTFHVDFPRLGVDAVELEAEPKLPAVHGDATLLVVEDDHMLLAVLRRRLSSWGYTVLEAGNAEAALELLRRRTEKVDLLLTDLVMPGLDGRELASRVLADRPTTRILYMSGYTDHPSVTRPLAPHDRVIAKPFVGNDLSVAIRDALRRPA